MKVAVIGAGGREHALCSALADSPKVKALYALPGNPGMAHIATCVALDTNDNEAVTDWCQEHAIDFVVIGPEVPLVNGLSDALSNNGIVVFGPSQAASKLESSKSFTKRLCKDHHIPTAAYGHFRHPHDAKAFLDHLQTPYVIKADGLAAGKGVVITRSKKEACEAIDQMLPKSETDASIVIEEYLDGVEVSFFALVDGDAIITLSTAGDHKRIGEADTGPNTGGMGTYSPSPFMNEKLEQKIIQRIIAPTVQAMKDENTPYQGVLFAGLMICHGEPFLLEYNVRFGDPETQAILPRLDCDLFDLLYATATGQLHDTNVQWKPEKSVCVVMASKGYPEHYEKGSAIDLTKASTHDNTTIFHAGTSLQDGALVATGGRVLNVVALGATIADAKARAYRAVDDVVWENGYYRRDIADKAIRHTMRNSENKV